MSHINGKYDDIIVPGLSTAQPASSNPSLTTIGGGNIQVYGFGTGDYVFGSCEIPHDYKEGSEIRPHIHWAPSSTDTGNCVWTMEYVVGSVDGAFSGATLTATDAGSGTAELHQIIETSAVISGSGRKIGDIITFRLLRNATGNTFTGTALLLSVGFHYEIDSMGSNALFAKN